MGKATIDGKAKVNPNKVKSNNQIKKNKNTTKTQQIQKLNKKIKKNTNRKGIPSGLKLNPKLIKNKHRRIALIQALRAKAKKNLQTERLKKKKMREEMGEQAVPKEVPQTIENTREVDPTFIAEADEEIAKEEEFDEFAKYFEKKVTPKILMTTCRRPSGKLFDFLKELHRAIPECYYYPRKNFRVKNIVQWAIKEEFTDILIFGSKSTKPSTLIISHLPEGPTATFNITSVKLNKKIHHHATGTSHYPEVILNNFDTRLGHRIGRMFAALFPQNPEFHGRRVITFHNQRDFIFFRHHRYIFSETGEQAHLQEIGPQFTLKLESLQHGTFDTKYGEFEFKYKPHSQVSRRKFFI